MRRTGTRRSHKIGDQVMRVVADILSAEVEDPRLESVTVSGVRMNSDLTVAEILYTFHGDKERRGEIEAALNKASGFIRSRLSKRIKAKRVPELRFEHDEYLEDMVYD